MHWANQRAAAVADSRFPSLGGRVVCRVESRSSSPSEAVVVVLAVAGLGATVLCSRSPRWRLESVESATRRTLPVRSFNLLTARYDYEISLAGQLECACWGW